MLSLDISLVGKHLSHLSRPHNRSASTAAAERSNVLPRCCAAGRVYADHECSQCIVRRRARSAARTRRSSLYFTGPTCAATEVPARKNCFPRTRISSRPLGNLTNSRIVAEAYPFVRSRNSTGSRPWFISAFPISTFSFSASCLQLPHIKTVVSTITSMTHGVFSVWCSPRSRGSQILWKAGPEAIRLLPKRHPACPWAGLTAQSLLKMYRPGRFSTKPAVYKPFLKLQLSSSLCNTEHRTQAMPSGSICSTLEACAPCLMP